MEFEQLTDFDDSTVDFQLTRFISTVKKYSWVILSLENIDESTLDLNRITNQTYRQGFEDSLTKASVFQTRYPVTDKQYMIDQNTDPNTFKKIPLLDQPNRK